MPTKLERERAAAEEQARRMREARAPAIEDDPAVTTDGGDVIINPDAAFAGDKPPESAAELEAFKEAKPDGPFSRDGRDYYVSASGKLKSVPAGFDAMGTFAGLTPATAERVAESDLQKRAGSLGDRFDAAVEAGVRTGAETIGGVSKFVEGVTGLPAGFAPEKLAPFAYTDAALDRRDANPWSATIGATAADIGAQLLLRGGGKGAAAARSLTIRRGLVGAVTGEASEVAVTGKPYSVVGSSVYGVQGVIFDGVANIPWRDAMRALGGKGRTAVEGALDNAQQSAVRELAHETDPAKKAEALRANAAPIYERTQRTLDETLVDIDGALEKGEASLFRPAMLKKRVSENFEAQSERVLQLAVQLDHAGQVIRAPLLNEVSEGLIDASASGPALFAALREARQRLSEQVIDSPLARRATEAIEDTLDDESLWGLASKDHKLWKQAPAPGGPALRVDDVTAREALDTRLERARAVQRATGNKRLLSLIRTAEEAIVEADAVTGARIGPAFEATPAGPPLTGARKAAQKVVKHGLMQGLGTATGGVLGFVTGGAPGGIIGGLAGSALGNIAEPYAEKVATRIASIGRKHGGKIGGGILAGAAAYETLAGEEGHEGLLAGAGALGAGLAGSALGKIAPHAYLKASNELAGWAKSNVRDGVLAQWTDDMKYGPLNRGIRDADMGAAAPHLQERAAELQRTLLDAHEEGYNLPGKAYRVVFMTEDQLANLASAKNVLAQGFMSTSSDINAAVRFGKEVSSLGGDPTKRGLRQVLLEVDQESGIPIAGKESELLLPAGSRFEVVGGKSYNGGPDFRLREVPGEPTTPDHLGRLPAPADADAFIAGGLLAVGAAEAMASDDGDGAAMGAAVVSVPALLKAFGKRGKWLGLREIERTLGHGIPYGDGLQYNNGGYKFHGPSGQFQANTAWFRDSPDGLVYEPPAEHLAKHAAKEAEKLSKKTAKATEKELFSLAKSGKQFAGTERAPGAPVEPFRVTPEVEAQVVTLRGPERAAMRELVDGLPSELPPVKLASKADLAAADAKQAQDSPYVDEQGLWKSPLFGEWVHGATVVLREPWLMEGATREQILDGLIKKFPDDHPEYNPERIEKLYNQLPEFAQLIKDNIVPTPTQHGTLFRGVSVSDETLRKMLTEKVFRSPGPLSSTYDPELAARFATGKYAGGLSANAITKGNKAPQKNPVMIRFTHLEEGVVLPNRREQEVLIPMSARFEVTGRYFDPELGIPVVDMRQLPGLHAEADWESTWKNAAILGGLLATGAALDDDSPEGMSAAGVGGLFLLYGRGGKSRLLQASLRRMGQVAKEFPDLVPLVDEVHKAFEPMAIDMARRGEVISRDEMNGMVHQLRQEVDERALWHLEKQGETLTEDARHNMTSYSMAWVDKMMIEATQTNGFRKAVDLDQETVMGEQIRRARGSNEGGLFKGLDGKTRYVKLYAEPQQAVGEKMAADVYRQAGIAAPETVTFPLDDGGTGFGSEFLRETQYYPMPLADIGEREAREFARGYWADVLLSNWDVVGLHGDNLLWSNAGEVVRIDNGSAFKYRAQGAAKPPALLDELTEIDGFFNPERNAQYAGLLKKAGYKSPKQLIEYLPPTLQGARDYIKQFGPDADPELVALLERRVELLEEYADKLGGEPVRRRPIRLGDIVRTKEIPASLKQYEGSWIHGAIEVPIRLQVGQLSPHRLDSSGFASHLEAQLHQVDQFGKGLLDKVRERTEHMADAKAALIEQYAREQVGLLRSNVELTAGLPEPPVLDEMGYEFLAAVSDNLSVSVGALSVEQKLALQRFTGDHSEALIAIMNGSADIDDASLSSWTKQAIEAMRESVPHLQEVTRAINVLKPTKQGPLYRGLDVGEAELNELLTLERFSPASILHTTHDERVGKRFARGDKRAVLLRFLDVEEATPVLHASAVPSENEWLLPQGGSYEVVNRYFSPLDDVFVIDLAQKAPPSDAHAVAAGALGLALTIGAAEMAQQQAEQEAGGPAPEEAVRIDATTSRLDYLESQSRALKASTARALVSPEAQRARTIAPLAGLTQSSGVGQFVGNQATLRGAYEEKREMLQRLQRDPMALVDEMAESLADVGEAAPELHRQIAQKTFEIATFLQGKLPGTIGPSLMRPEGTPPSETAVRQFALYYSAATNPSSVYTDLANNRIRKEQVDTLKQLWPEVYEGLKVAIVDQLAQGSRPSIQQRSRLDLLFDFGGVLDRGLSPRLVAALRAHQESKPDKPPGARMPSRGTQPSVAAASPYRGLSGPANHAAA